MTDRISLPSDQDATGRTFGPEELEAVRQCLETGTLTSTKGNFVKQLETSFAAKIGAKFAYACSSGTAAIHCAVAASESGTRRRNHHDAHHRHGSSHADHLSGRDSGILRR